jgi:prepilin-type N-terminal cleavage/methylation domain-containing protein
MRGVKGPLALRNTGFTLIEVLITLVIVAAAGSMILAKTRGLLDYHSRFFAHQQEVTRLLSRTALLHVELSRDLVTEVREKRVIVRGKQQANGEAPLAEVENVLGIVRTDPPGTGSPSSAPPPPPPPSIAPPPIAQAYTPFQRYTLTQGAKRMALLLPGLPSPYQSNTNTNTKDNDKSGDPAK